jgi:hypothetical protein
MAKRKVKAVVDDTPDNGKLQKLVDFCMDKYQEFKDSPYRKAKLDEIDEARKAYEQKKQAVTFPWKDASNLIVPLTTIAVDNLEPRLVAGLIGAEPLLLFDTSDKILKTIENDFNKELKDVCRAEEFARNAAHQTLIEGTYYVVPMYDKQKRKISDFVYQAAVQKNQNGKAVPVLGKDMKPVTTDRIQIDENGEPLTEEKETTVFEGGKFEYVPFNDVFCADNLGTIEDWEREPVIRLIRPTYPELMWKRDQLGYMNIGKWLLSNKSNANEKTDESKTAGQKLDDAGITGKETIDSIEVHLSYLLPLDNEEEEDKRESFEEEKIIVTIALKSKIAYRLVKQREINWNNEKVIKRIRINAELDRSFGTGVYGKIKSLQNGASDVFNNIMNESTIQMLPWFFYDERSGLKGKQEIFPGKGVPCENVEGIKFPEFKGDPGRLIVVFDSFITFWERMTSVSDPQVGRLSDRKETATGILTAVQEGNIKHNYQSNSMKDEFLACLKTMYDLYYQNMPYDKTLQYEGQTVVYPRQAMRRPVKFKLTGSTEKANKILSRKESEDLWTLFRADPLSNPVRLFEDILKNYGKDNPKEYINPQVNQMIQIFTAFPDLVPVVMKLAQQKQMEAQAGKGGNGGGMAA